MSYETFLSVALTAVTVVLAVIAVLIAVLALWGYRSIKEEAKAIAEKAAKETIAEYMNSQSIQDKLKAEVLKRLEENADKVYDDLAMSTAFPQRYVDMQQPSIAPDFPEEPQS